MKIKYFTLFLFLSTGALAQDTWTLDRTVREVLAKNPAMQAGREKIIENDAQVFLARTHLGPSVTATATAVTAKDAANSPSARFGASDYNSYSLLLRADQPLLRWGLFSGVSIPKRERDAQLLTYEMQERDLAAETIRSFYSLLLNQRYVEILRNIDRVLNDSLATAQRRQGTGRGQRLDVLQVKTQVALLTPKLAKALNETELASATLANLLGNPNLSEIRVNGKLEIVPVSAISENIDFKNFNLPEYKRAQISEELVRAKKSYALGASLPTLGAFGTWGRSSTTKSDLLDSNSTAWTLGLQLTIPLFSSFSTVAERRLYASQIAQARLEQKNIENKLMLQQVKGLKSLKLAQETISSLNLAFNLADDSLKEAKRSFQYANIDFVQYLSIQQGYLDAASSLDKAKYDYINALLEYYMASGQSLEKLIGLMTGKSA